MFKNDEVSALANNEAGADHNSAISLIAFAYRLITQRASTHNNVGLRRDGRGAQQGSNRQQGKRVYETASLEREFRHIHLPSGFCRQNNNAVYDRFKGLFRAFNATRTKKGLPDVVVCNGPTGTMVALEVKAPRGYQSPEQKTMQALIEAAGGFSSSSVARMMWRTSRRGLAEVH
jgi:hypothetical protein